MASRGGLSRATFAKLSPHPYLLANLEPADKQTPPGRSNGRAVDEARPMAVQLSSLSHAHGSALVRMGDTTAVCGVRGETLLMANAAGDGGGSPSATELMDHHLLVPNIELATGCAPEFLPGGPPTTLAQTLSSRIYSLLHSSRLLEPDELRIWHTPPIDDDAPAPDDEMAAVDDQDGRRTANSYIAAYWVLYIDVFFISLDGNPFDAAWAATVAALGDTKLPRARYDADRQRVVCSRDPPRPLTLTGLPVACTAVVFTGKETDRPTDGKHWLLVDPDRLEESLCDESLTVVVDFRHHQLKILSIAKQGGVLITARQLRSPEIWAWASKRWKDTAAALRGPNRIAD